MTWFFKPEPTFDEVAPPEAKQLRAELRDAAQVACDNLRSAIYNSQPSEALQWLEIARQAEHLAIVLPIALLSELNQS